MATTKTPVRIGTVIEDSYGNPAVVVGLDHNGAARIVVQTVGSDRGRVASAGLTPGREMTGARAEWARQIVRDLWATLPQKVRETAARQS